MIYDILPVNNYSGNNSTTEFEFNFYIDNEEQIAVYHFDKNGIETLLKNGIDYSVNEIKNKNGSYITFPLNSSNYSILDNNEKISIELTLPISQETQFNNSSLLNLETLEYCFDYLTRLIQIISRKVARCVKVSECSTTTPDDLINEINDIAKTASDALSDIEEKNKEIEKYASQIDEINENISQNQEKFNKIDELEISKTDTNLSNLTTDAQKLISNLIMPSYKFIEYEARVADKVNPYIAPEAGWFYCMIVPKGNNYSGYSVGLQVDDPNLDEGKIASKMNLSNGNFVHVFVPVSKNDRVTISGHDSLIDASRTLVKFIYANGTNNDN